MQIVLVDHFQLMILRLQVLQPEMPALFHVDKGKAQLPTAPNLLQDRGLQHFNPLEIDLLDDQQMSDIEWESLKNARQNASSRAETLALSP